MAKGWFEKFGGFTISFAEITVEMSTESESDKTEFVSNFQYTL